MARSSQSPTPRSGVSINLPSRPLANSDAIFVVRRGGEKLGELRVSKGGIDWYPRHAKTPITIGWRKFARLLAEHG